MLQAQKVLRDRYKLQTLLSNHPSRQVWLATDLQAQDADQEQVVLKFLGFGSHIQWEDLKLFEREAQVLQQLNHAHIPQCYDYFSFEEDIFWFALVEQYIEGNSLGFLLKKGTFFTEEEIIHIAQEILKILIYLHQSRPPIIHRDIKPDNIILGQNDRIYLVDFGAVKNKTISESNLSTSITVVGTYGYTPIEQFGGRAVPASDLYALGASLIHLLTGVLPANLPQKNLRIQFRDLINISDHLANWLSKMTEPDVENRFATAQNALATLNAEQPIELFEPPHNTKIDIYKSDKIFRATIPYEYLQSPIATRIIKILAIGYKKFLEITAPILICLTVIWIVLALLSYPVNAIRLALFVVALMYLLGTVIINKISNYHEKKFLISKNNQSKKIKISRKLFGIAYANNYFDLDQDTILDFLAFGNNNDLVLNNYKLYLKLNEKKIKLGQNFTQLECDWLISEIKIWLNIY